MGMKHGIVFLNSQRIKIKNNLYTDKISKILNQYKDRKSNLTWIVIAISRDLLVQVQR